MAEYVPLTGNPVVDAVAGAFVGKLLGGIFGGGASPAEKASARMLDYQQTLTRLYGEPLLQQTLYQQQMIQPHLQYLSDILGLQSGWLSPYTPGVTPVTATRTKGTTAPRNQLPTAQSLSTGLKTVLNVWSYPELARMTDKERQTWLSQNPRAQNVYITQDMANAVARGQVSPYDLVSGKITLQTTPEQQAQTGIPVLQNLSVGPINTPTTKLGATGPGLTSAKSQWWMEVPTAKINLPAVPGFATSQLPAAYTYNPATMPQAYTLRGNTETQLMDMPNWRQVQGEVESAYNVLNKLGLENLKKQRAGQLSAELAKRGLGSSSLDLSRMSGLENWYTKTAAELGAQGKLQGLSAAQAVRSERQSAVQALEEMRKAQAAAELQRFLSSEQLKQLAAQEAMNRFLTGEDIAAKRRAEETQRILTAEELERLRRAEAAQNFWNILNALRGGVAQTGTVGNLGTMLSGVTGLASAYSDLAKLQEARAGGTASTIADIMKYLYQMQGTNKG